MNSSMEEFLDTHMEVLCEIHTAIQEWRERVPERAYLLDEMKFTDMAEEFYKLSSPPVVITGEKGMEEGEDETTECSDDSDFA